MTEKAKLVAELTDKVTVVRSEAKKDWIKTSFWMPENTPEVKDEDGKPPCKTLFCPIFDQMEPKTKHPIRVKELVSLHFGPDYTCWLCSKVL
jgi:nitric oxide synthase-interacting protein